MERLDSSLRGVLREAGVQDAGALAEVARRWPEVVGDPIARAAWPQRISRDGTLLVTTTSSAWAFELGLLGEEILRKLADALGPAVPCAIRFVPGPVPAPPAAVPSQAPERPPIDDETRALAEQLTAAMTDAELRTTIARAAAASLARPPSDRGF
jgi:predicted nucleic acid-binding Zn ribbon protein